MVLVRGVVFLGGGFLGGGCEDDEFIVFKVSRLMFDRDCTLGQVLRGWVPFFHLVLHVLWFP